MKGLIIALFGVGFCVLIELCVWRPSLELLHHILSL